MSKSTGSTSAGNINRDTSQNVGSSKQKGSDTSFGQKIGRSEDLENEPSRKSGSVGSSSSDRGMSSSSGRSSGSSMGSKGSSGNSGRNL
jgi:hypothetical protein